MLPVNQLCSWLPIMLLAINYAQNYASIIGKEYFHIVGSWLNYTLEFLWTFSLSLPCIFRWSSSMEGPRMFVEINVWVTDRHSARGEPIHFYNMPQLLDFIGCLNRLKFHYGLDKIILETFAGSTQLDYQHVQLGMYKRHYKSRAISRPVSCL